MDEERVDQEQNRQVDSRMRKGKRLWRLVFVLLFLAVPCFGGFFLYLRLNQVEPAFSSAVYELGDGISSNLEDYLSGPKQAVERGELDLSQVDQSKPGIYQATVRCDGNEFQYEIIIQDTIAPVIVLREKPVYLALDREYSVEELVQGVEDADSQVALYLQEAGPKGKTVSYHSEGTFMCTLIAEDSSGNHSTVNLSVAVNPAPVISGVRDIYMIPGSQVDYLEQVEAWDETDGNLTDKITVDDREVDPAQEGIYRLIYRVEDGLGIDAVSYADVVVASAEELQKLIGSRQVNRDSDRIIGAINPYDAGASSQDNISDTLEYMKPALVQLYYGDSAGYSAGSGYLMEITEDTIYICSNRHVVQGHDRWDVYFFDGTKVQGDMLGYSDGYDVGVVAVAVQDVPEELLKQLMTIHIDRGYWSGLNDQRIDVGLERVDRNGGILHTSTGVLLKVKQYFDWYDRLDHTEVTLKLERGDSGSAVLDGYGNLIAMAYAYSSSPRRYWCVPLDGILDGYEEITGRRGYVY